MTAPYVVAPAALDDIDEAAVFIAERNPSAGHRLVDDLYDAFGMIAENPHLGHTRTDLTPLPVYFWTTFKRRYAIVYRKTTPLQIVRVLAWKRDVAAELDEESDGPPTVP